MDIYSKKKRSELMSKIRSKGTKLEQKGRSLLRETGVRFSKHPQEVYGKPDAGNKERKIAIFFDSEFWHGCDWKNRKKDFKSNRKFWVTKIEKNMRRDREVNRQLRKNGWTVIRIWEKDMTKNKRQKTLKRLSILLPAPQRRVEWQNDGV